MSYLRSFAPWIAYIAGSAIADWRLGAVAGLVVAVVVLVRSRADGLDLLTVTTAAFFAVLAPLALLDPDAAVRPYAPAMSLAVLGLAAAASLVVGRPFTEAMARRATPPAFWSTDVFRRANVVITSVWAASFLVTATVCAAVISVDPALTPVWVTAEVIGFIVPLRFTAAYRARLRARLAPVMA